MERFLIPSVRLTMVYIWNLQVWMDGSQGESSHPKLLNLPGIRATWCFLQKHWLLCTIAAWNLICFFSTKRLHTATHFLRMCFSVVCESTDSTCPLNMISSNLDSSSKQINFLHHPLNKKRIFLTSLFFIWNSSS